MAARPARTRTQGEDGIALVTVLLVTALITTLVVAITSMTLANLRSSSDHDNFEGAIAAAETGVDQELAALQKDQHFSSGPAIGTTYTTDTAEWNWAVTTIKAQIAAGQPYVSTGQGQFFAIKPADHNVIYSLGCDPSCTASGAKKRLLKVEYIFSPYKPGNAILTAGNLTLDASVLVGVTGQTVANVHTNGDALLSGGSGIVYGDVTSSGSMSGSLKTVGPGSASGQPLQTVPAVKARFLYDTYSSPYASSWYDLCPDGTVKSPASTPCSGDPVADLSTGGLFRGWSYSAGTGGAAPLWSVASNDWGSGIYYVYQGDAAINQNTTVTAATVIAEAAPSGGPTWSCGANGGNVNAKLATLSSVALPGVALLADGDLSVTSHFNGGIGLFGAGNQVHIETSSDFITGTVVANDTCTQTGGADPNGMEVDTNQVKNSEIHFDENVEIPLVDIIRTTQWLEMNPSN